MAYALEVSPDCHPEQVAIWDTSRRKIVSVAIPPRLPPEKAADPDEDPPAAGWDFQGARVTFEGKVVKVAACRVGLLKLLAETDGPIRCEDLADGGWAPGHRRTGPENVRRHIGMLREEIRTGVPALEFDPITAQGQGYELVLR